MMILSLFHFAMDRQLLSASTKRRSLHTRYTQALDSIKERRGNKRQTDTQREGETEKRLNDTYDRHLHLYII